MPRDSFVVTPEGWLSRGEAFVPGDGQQLAVFGGIPGEPARVRIFSRQGHQARGRAISPAGAPSPDRVAPPCDKWGPCGGCPWMHLSPAGRARAHDRLWIDAAQLAGAQLPLSPVHLAEMGHASELKVEWDYSDRGQPRLGVSAREGAGTVAIPKCAKVSDGVRTFMGAVAATLKEANVPPGRDGPLRGIRGRVSRGEILVIVRLPRPVPALAEWAGLLASNITELRGVVTVFPPDNDPKGIGQQRLYGYDWIPVSVAGAELRIGAEEAWPRDLVAYDRLLRAAPELLGVEAGDAVLDMGTGNGARLLVLSRASGWAVGVESDDKLADRATGNLRDNGAPAEVVVDGWVEAVERVAPRLAGRRPLAWVDCGRKELGQRAVEVIRGLDPRRVALEGSNPAAVCREVARWQRDGWTLARFERFETEAHAPFTQAVAVMASPNQSAPEKRAPRRRAVR
ncbi:MAG: hypothetical protein FJ090_09085 [Deltaproteobacteria bacterium]|nr:hypothetical protein [Deltaproteobacteria bacterium]